MADDEYEFNEDRTKRRPKKPQGYARRYDEDWQDIPKEKLTYTGKGQDKAPPTDDSPHAKMMRASAAAKKKADAEREAAKSTLTK